MRQKQGVFSLFLLSPSSRRAWIEIQLLEGPEQRHHVALLAEGVDRNVKESVKYTGTTVSPSSRRAWIEILLSETFSGVRGSRPPRGGRG